MFGGNYETAYICNTFSCRDDNAYSLVKSSLVFVLVLVLRCEHQNFFASLCHMPSHDATFQDRNGAAISISTVRNDAGRYS